MAVFCSFIVPVYNVAAYLDRCVGSVLGQSCGDLELILVDDGSTDGSGAICDRYEKADPRVRVIHQENGGHTAARNAGLRAAAGRYVAFVDSDDWVERTLLADCAAVCRDYSPDTILFGYSRVSSGKVVKKPQKYAPGSYTQADIRQKILPTLLESGRFSLCERLVLRELAVKHQFSVDRGLLVGEDLACCVCMMADSQALYVLPGCYYFYLQREGSVVHTHKNYTFENWSLLRAYLTRNLAQRLPDFPEQLGTCSVRFLQRAVLGEFARCSRAGEAAARARAELKRQDFRQDLRLARIPPRARAARFKRFCLKHRLICLLYLSDRAVAILRNRGN